MLVVGNKGDYGDHFIYNFHFYISNYNEVSKTEGEGARNKVECVQALN